MNWPLRCRCSPPWSAKQEFELRNDEMVLPRGGVVMRLAHKKTPSKPLGFARAFKSAMTYFPAEAVSSARQA